MGGLGDHDGRNAQTREEAVLQKLLAEEVLAARAAEHRASRERLGNWLIGSGVAVAVVGSVGLVYSLTGGVSAVDSATNPAALQSAVSTGQAIGVTGVALLGVGAASLVSGLVAYATAD